MAVVFKKPSTLTDAPLHYCPGCTHGIIHRLVAEAIEELGIDGKTVGVASVGCSVMCYDYFTCDMVQAPHGRAQAVATGIKRAKPEDVVFTYQGDRYGGDRPRGNARRKHHRYFCKQCNLRHDRRPDGADIPAESGHADHPVRS